MSRRRVFLIRLFWCLALGLGSVLGGCEPKGGGKDTLGVLKTDIPNNLVVFSSVPVGGTQLQKVLLYNDGRIPVVIDSFALKGSSAEIFRLQPKPSVPLTLAPGKAKGIGFEIEFYPDSAGTYRASIAIGSPNVENVDDQGFFQIHLFAQVIRGTPSQSVLSFPNCKEGLDFGPVKKGAVSYKSCKVVNTSGADVQIANIQFLRKAGGDTDFRWLNPPLPATLKPQQEVDIELSFSPTAQESSGEFVLQLQPSSGAGGPSLKVQGKAAP